MERFSLSDNADMVADAMHELAVWSKSHPNSQLYKRGLIKLPPVFTSDKYGDPKRNLVAMIRTLSEYEDGREDGSLPTLSELPAIYNSHGGGPELSDKDIRKVHNWLQQTSFGVRAAMIHREQQSPTKELESMDIPERVYQLLYANNPKRVFVAFSPDNKYELKPLRYANEEAKKRWLRQEYAQIAGGRRVTASDFGATPTQAEWDAFGLRGQMRTLFASVSSQIEALVREAELLDSEGRFDDADEVDGRLSALFHNLITLDQLDNNAA